MNYSQKSISKIKFDTDIITARETGRNIAKKIGFSSHEQTLIATAISEVARNILEYAKIGEIEIFQIYTDGKTGIIVIAKDYGPGIHDVNKALEDGFTTGEGMGLGLPGARRLMDDFEIQSEIGEGTIVTMKKWLLQ